MSVIKFSSHALQRMFERNIQTKDVIEALDKGMVIREYPEDKPYPSELILAYLNDKPIHIVVASNEINDERIIITVYQPDKKIWENDYKTRREE